MPRLPNGRHRACLMPFTYTLMVTRRWGKFFHGERGGSDEGHVTGAPQTRRPAPEAEAARRGARGARGRRGGRDRGITAYRSQEARAPRDCRTPAPQKWAATLKGGTLQTPPPEPRSQHAWLGAQEVPFLPSVWATQTQAKLVSEGHSVGGWIWGLPPKLV